MAKPVFVELTGPAGSGKSTIAEEIRRLSANRFGHIGRPDVGARQRLIAHLRAIVQIWRLDPCHKINQYGRRRLVRAIATIDAATQWMEGRGPGIHLLDEGPIRVLMDYACHSEHQFAAWHRYSEMALRRLEESFILVVRVMAEDDNRYRRRKHRMSRLEQYDPKYNLQASNISNNLRETKLLFNRDWITEKIDNGRVPSISMVTVSNDMDVIQSAREIIKWVDVFRNRTCGRG